MLAWLWQSFPNVYAYQNIMLHILKYVWFLFVNYNSIKLGGKVTKRYPWHCTFHCTKNTKQSFKQILNSKYLGVKSIHTIIYFEMHSKKWDELMGVKKGWTYAYLHNKANLTKSKFQNVGGRCSLNNSNFSVCFRILWIKCWGGKCQTGFLNQLPCTGNMSINLNQLPSLCMCTQRGMNVTHTEMQEQLRTLYSSTTPERTVLSIAKTPVL